MHFLAAQGSGTLRSVKVVDCLEEIDSVRSIGPVNILLRDLKSKSMINHLIRFTEAMLLAVDGVILSLFALLAYGLLN